ncbi:MAG: septal ring lytic transglycosylase RlpA family protein [Legionellaceae bacterium]|nr:septal ring lytic transglycosylase RlpA family protein [Legionellaceae bacterium]
MGKVTRIYVVLTLGLMVLLGCQTTHDVTDKDASLPKKGRIGHHRVHKNTKSFIPTEKDSAPAGPAPTVFKEVKPVNGPLSRYGNPSAYNVNGHHYRVMTTATGYRTRGLASWYGTKFHTRRTSSGEHYDMYALTAAHKTLPLPTYVRVKNLKNGRVAIVKVNDRGPFHSGRIIDLSYGAAAKLGIFPQGTAPVEIEALAMNGHKAHYYLQAGAFESNTLAEQLQLKLSKISPSPVFIEKDKHRFLVRVGPFATKSMSDRLKSVLASKGVAGAFSMLM